MKKNSFKTRLLSFAAFCGLALAFASCASEDVAQSTTGTDNDKNLTTFVAGDEAKTRTSMDYTTGNFFWEAGDKIYVKDDDGTWQVSNNAPTSKVASFKFKVPGKFKNHTSYKVYYPGKNGSNDQVTIPAAQTQATPNTTNHFGESGDCGTADASKQLNGSFAFALDHQAAILVFQPYTSNTILQSCYLIKIEVSSDNDITHTYTLDPTTGELTGTGSGKQIILTTGGSGFPLTNSTASVTTNGAYMVIKPGTHTLKIRYWVRDVATWTEGTITKTLSSHTYAKNTYYDMTANLNVKDYDGDHYCMWDAQQQYWYGYEWTKHLPSGIGQPTLVGNPAGNYPQSSSDVLRWYNSGSGMFVATRSCAIAPNINELAWYAKNGDPHWDADELWTSMGHLYKGGVWLKKKLYISGFNTNTAPDGTDWRVGNGGSFPITNNSISASEINKYFYLPALGVYVNGKLSRIGESGWYWSSSSDPAYNTTAGCLSFNQFQIVAAIQSSRETGGRVQVFE